jgi:hypothetical protein
MKLKVNVRGEDGKRKRTSLTFMASRHCDNVRAVIFNFSPLFCPCTRRKFSIFVVAGDTKRWWWWKNWNLIKKIYKILPIHISFESECWNRLELVWMGRYGQFGCFLMRTSAKAVKISDCPSNSRCPCEKSSWEL